MLQSLKDLLSFLDKLIRKGERLLKYRYRYSSSRSVLFYVC